MTESRKKIVVAYCAAIIAGIITLCIVDGTSLWKAFVADCVATVVIFIFSRVHKNSSFYDAYWSVIPPLLAIYWAATAIPGIAPARQWLVFVLVSLWAVRLTWNWASHWSGLDHEDWRYGPLREKAGPFAILVDFFGIHLIPTLQVFAGCLPLYAAMHLGVAPLGWLDGLAAFVTLGAIAIETLADIQLHRFLATRQPGQIINTGLWSWSRHPNYFGELSFWWGLALFGLAAWPIGWWWQIVGAVLMTAMFMFASIPMMDKRSVERRPEYEAHMKKVSALVPLPPKK
jgi:steroid 5-alpha reductase family enzyme